MSRSGRADQVHVQTRNHRSCADQRAQIAHVGETLALDMEYVRTRSVALDLKIILLTIKQVVIAHGAL